MNKLARLVSGVMAFSAFGLISAAEASPFLYEDFSNVYKADTYWGGTNLYNNSGPYGDIIANDVPEANLATASKFSVLGMDVSKIGDDLIVVINTNYASTIGAGNVGFLNTSMGALFLGLGAPNYNGADAGAAHKDDTFVGDEGRFDFAFVPSSATNPTATTNIAELKPLNPLAASDPLSDVQLSYYPSTVNTSGSNFRTGQAVGYKGNGASVTSGLWQVTDSTHISFTIADFFALSLLTDHLQTSLTLAWAMTCANDVIVTTLDLLAKPPEEITETPLPAGLVLLISGLTGLGVLNRFKSKSAA